jgi:hypothetical protein
MITCSWFSAFVEEYVGSLLCLHLPLELLLLPLQLKLSHPAVVHLCPSPPLQPTVVQIVPALHILTYMNPPLPK